MGWLDVGTCTLLSLAGSVDVDERGWTLEEELELRGCREVHLTLQDGEELVEIEGRYRRLGTNGRLDPSQVVRTATRPDGVRRYTVLLGLVERGDVALIRVSRRLTQPRDLTWRPGQAGASWSELRVPRRLDVTVEGLGLDRRGVYGDVPTADARAVVAHPWAEVEPPLPVPSSDEGLSASEALERVSQWTLVPRAVGGPEILAGDHAAALRLADDRGIARSIAGLAAGGPDRVEVGRWAPTAGASPAPDALEVAVWHADEARLLLHPDQIVPPGVLVTEDGELPIPVAPAAAVETAPRTVQWRGEAILAVDGRDPIARLRPGGGLTWQETLHATWAPGDDAAWVFVPLPEDVLDAQSDCAHARVTDDGAWLVADPEARACSLSLTRPLHDAWLDLSEPLAAAPVTATARWTRPDGSEAIGSVAVEDGAVRLAALADTLLLVDRARLEQEIADRVVAASYPQPAIPGHFIADEAPWDLAAALPELLRLRTLVDPRVDVRADRPRRLVPARASGVLSPAEAAHVVAQYARQARLRADAVLVRSLPADAPSGVAPTGFDEALVRIVHEGQVGWLDPGCEPCAPFEVRPQLLGAPALGGGLLRTPAPHPDDEGLPPGIAWDDGVWSADESRLPSGIGAWTAALTSEDDGWQVAWTLRGAEALEWRLYGDEVDADDLQELLGAEGPVGIDGADTPGEDIHVVWHTDDAPRLHPLALTPRTHDGVRVGFLTLRTVRHPLPEDPADLACDATDGAWGWRVRPTPDAWEEQLLVRVPTLDGAQLRALRACRLRAGLDPLP